MSNQKYKVIALSVGGLNNKVYQSGDIVDAGAFSAPIEKMVAEGWLEPVDAPEAAAITASGTDASVTESKVTPGSDLVEKAKGAKRGK